MFIDPALTPKFHAALRKYADQISAPTLSRQLAGNYTEAMVRLFNNPELAQAWADDAQAAAEKAVQQAREE